MKAVEAAEVVLRELKADPHWKASDILFYPDGVSGGCFATTACLTGEQIAALRAAWERAYTGA